MEQKNITVEVFRDQDNPKMSVEAAEGGIDRIRRVTTGIEIVRATNILRIADKEAESADIREINWPDFEADMNIVLTNRKIDDGYHKDFTRGISRSVKGIGALKVAVIDVGRDFSDITVAHEVSHLFSLKESGENWDKHGHCIDGSCVMHAAPSFELITKRVPARGFMKWMYRLGYSDSPYEKQLVPAVDEFCDECALQLDKKAFFHKQAKEGKDIPISWL